MLSYEHIMKKGLSMSKLDLIEQETLLLDVKELSDKLINHNELLDQGKMEIDPQEWIEVFEEDQVVMYGCR
jgi:hypothetical protein